MPQSEQESLGALVERLSRPRYAGRAMAWVVDLPVVGSLVARAFRAPMRLRWLSARITRFHGRLIQASGGRLRRSWLFAAGQPVLTLTTTGRRSGQTRSTAVACFTLGDDLALAAMNLGQTRHPGWSYNLTAHPQAMVHIAGTDIHVVARRLAGTEADRAWERWLELQPSARRFREISARDIPLFVLTRNDNGRALSDAPA